MSSHDTKWQPIETAPKNEWILCHYDERVTSLDTSWHWGEEDCRSFIMMRKGKGYRRGGGDNWCSSDDEFLIEPTHWMPLPEPPNE